MDGAFSDGTSLLQRHAQFGSGTPAGSSACSWDCGRELRVMQDAACRSRAEEAGALRRSADEIERCALRRQTEECAALQNFLRGFHGFVEAVLEHQRMQCAGRCDVLERRLEAEEHASKSAGGQRFSAWRSCGVRS